MDKHLLTAKSSKPRVSSASHANAAVVTVMVVTAEASVKAMPTSPQAK